MTQHPRPAVGPFEEVAQAPMTRIGTRVRQPTFMQPTRLRHADSLRRLAALKEMQQRDLHSQRQLLLQHAVTPHAPEDQAPGKRQQM